MIGNGLGSTGRRVCDRALRTGTSSTSDAGPDPELRAPSHEEAVLTAIVAAVLFGIALLLHLAGLALGPLDSTFFMLAGLVAAALHLAGVGTTLRHRVRR
jgi:hypothetical protein